MLATESDNPMSSVARLGAALPPVFAAAALAAPALANVALGLMLLAALAVPHMRATLLRAPPLWLLAAFLLFCAGALLTVWPVAQRDADLAAMRDLVQLWWFVPLALWIGADYRRALRCLTVAAAVFVLGRLWATDWSAPPWPGGERVRLGFSSINHFAQYAAALTVGLVSLAPRAWRAARARPPAVRWLGACLWLAVTLLALYWLAVSASRGVWLAFVITLAAMLAAVGLRCGWRALVAAVAVAALSAVLVVATFGNALAPRIVADAESRARVLAGDIAAVGEDALGLRVRMLAVAARLAAEAPLAGHGPGAVARLLANEDGVLGAAGFTHMHNVFADLQVRVGLLGGAIVHAMFAWVLLAAWTARRRAAMPFDTWLAVSAMLLLALLCNQTDLRLAGWDWRFFWVLIAGVAAAPTLSCGLAILQTRNRNTAVTGA